MEDIDPSLLPQSPVLTDYNTLFLPFNQSWNMKLYTVFTIPWMGYRPASRFMLQIKSYRITRTYFCKWSRIHIYTHSDQLLHALQKNKTPPYQWSLKPCIIQSYTRHSLFVGGLFPKTTPKAKIYEYLITPWKKKCCSNILVFSFLCRSILEDRYDYSHSPGGSVT